MNFWRSICRRSERGFPLGTAGRKKKKKEKADLLKVKKEMWKGLRRRKEKKGEGVRSRNARFLGGRKGLGREKSAGKERKKKRSPQPHNFLRERDN